jgi:DNA-binding CsgD family transcriptional regulator
MMPIGQRTTGMGATDGASGNDIWNRLTQRERQVARKLVEGFSYASIAAALGVSYHTVNTHVKAIYRKAAVESRARFTAVVLMQPPDESP